MDKYIYKRKAFSKEQCEQLIKVFEKNDLVPNLSRGYLAVYSILDKYEFLFMKPILKEHMMNYANKHKFLHDIYSGWGIVQEFHLQKYLPGKSYSREHMGHGKDSWDSNRLLGWMIYLNDIKKGGGTRWPQQNFTSKPRVGDLYIWPSAWTHSHHGVAAPKEIKYIITGWCNFDPEATKRRNRKFGYGDGSMFPSD